MELGKDTYTETYLDVALYLFYHHPQNGCHDRIKSICSYRIWDQCNMMQDFIEILDGWGPTATTLAHLCSGETIPEIISSGPELLVKFHTSPYGNPFHPLPLSYLPGFELEIEVCVCNFLGIMKHSRWKLDSIIFISMKSWTKVSYPLYLLPTVPHSSFHLLSHSPSKRPSES